MGYWDCEWTADYQINFTIDYSGVVEAFNIPIWYGGSYMEIGAAYTYKFGNEEQHTNLIFLKNEWEYTGRWNLWPPEKPYKFPAYYGRKIHCEAGYRYYFIMQFDVWVDAGSAGFEVVAGKVVLDASFLEAEIVNPLYKADLVCTPVIEIDGDYYWAIWTTPWYFQSGETITINGSVFNFGTKTTGSFTVGLYFDGNLIGSAEIDELPPGYYVPLYYPDFQWPNDYKWHTITFVADVNYEVDELSENNNEGTIYKRALGPPDLEIEDMTLTLADSWPPQSIDWKNADE
ncbi:MAG: hypothetical protein DRJ99_01420, partial [Thermoplasmata archaeon]